MPVVVSVGGILWAPTVCGCGSVSGYLRLLWLRLLDIIVW
jgi:hypothetical protein